MIHVDLHRPGVATVVISPPLWLRIVTLGLARSRDGLVAYVGRRWCWDCGFVYGCGYEPVSPAVRRAIARAELSRLRFEQQATSERRGTR